MNNITIEITQKHIDATRHSLMSAPTLSLEESFPNSKVIISQGNAMIWYKHAVYQYSIPEIKRLREFEDMEMHGLFAEPTSFQARLIAIEHFPGQRRMA